MGGREAVRVKVLNASRGGLLAERAAVANTPSSRRRGLLGTEMLEEGDGLLITPCRQVHTLGMRYPIDLVFLDVEGRVVKTVRGLRPWRLSPFVLRARAVLEVPAGTVEGSGTAPGDRLRFLPCCTGETGCGCMTFGLGDFSRRRVLSRKRSRRRRPPGRIIDL